MTTPEPQIPEKYVVKDGDRFYTRWGKRYNAWGYAAGFRWSYRLTGWLLTTSLRAHLWWLAAGVAIVCVIVWLTQ